MSASLDNGEQSVDQSTLLEPDVFRPVRGRWVQVGDSRSPTAAQRLYEPGEFSPDEFWGVGSAMWWDQPPTVTSLIVHYTNGSWSVIEKLRK